MALSEKERTLCRLTAAIVLGRWEELAQLREQAPPGEPDRAWREAVLQCHLFAGFPRVVEAFEVLDRAGGLGTPDPDELVRCDADGVGLFDRIYAELSESVQRRIGDFHGEFARWILEHAYGRVMSRPGLSVDRRELCSIVALAVTGQHRQLMSHVRGAVRCGATVDEIRAALATVSDLIDAAALDPIIDRFAGGSR